MLLPDNVCIPDTWADVVNQQNNLTRLPFNLRPTTRECVHSILLRTITRWILHATHLALRAFHVCIIWHRYDAWNFPSLCLCDAPQWLNALAVMAVVVMLSLQHRGWQDNMPVVMRGHFQSHNKDGSHSVAENPMLHANFTALCFIEPELLPMEVLHCGNREFLPFCSCNLDLDLMTFIYELDSYSLRCTGCAKMIFICQGFWKLLSDRETYRQTPSKLYTMWLRGWSKITTNNVCQWWACDAVLSDVSFLNS